MKQPFVFSKFAEKLALNVVAVLSAAFALFLTMVSLLHTTVVDKIEEGQGMQTVVYQIAERIESVSYLHDNLFLNLIVLCALLMLCFLIVQRKKPVRLRWLCLFLFVWTAALGIVWVLSSQCKPSEDSLTVSDAALAFARNNYSDLVDIRYFHNYSFQLGYVFFNEMIFRFLELFKPVENMMPLEVLNAFFLGVINTVLLLIVHELFRDPRINLVAAVLLAASTAPIISCSFVYGIFPGMMFAVAAVYCEIRWLRDCKIHFAVLSVMCITLAVMIKSNYLIWLIALTAFRLINLLGRKEYRVADLLWMAAAVTAALGVQSAVLSHYEGICGESLRDTVPYISWIAMGLNETELAPGWYDYGYTLTNFEDADYDPEVAGERSAEEVRTRLKYFASHPQYTNDFFYLKVVSQWNETSYESIWNNIVRFQYDDKGPIAEWVCSGQPGLVRKIMDFFAQLVFFGFLLGCFAMRRRGDFMLTPLPIVFLGGFFYQLISEGKSQYIMPYFIAMTAFSAFGIVSFYDMLVKYLPADSALRKLLGAKPEPAAETTAAAISDKAPTPAAEAPAESKTEPAAPPAQQGSRKNRKNKKKKEKHHG